MSIFYYSFIACQDFFEEIYPQLKDDYYAPNRAIDNDFVNKNV